MIPNNGSSSVSAAQIEPMPTPLDWVTSTVHFPGAAVKVFPPKAGEVHLVSHEAEARQDALGSGLSGSAPT